MKKSNHSIYLVLILLSLSVIGCALSPSLVPSNSKNTEPSETIPVSKFEFFDVSIDQASKDTVTISFGYRINKDLDTNGMQIMAQPQKNDVNCSIKEFTTNSKPYILEGDAPDLVRNDNITTLSLTTPAKCSFKGFTLMVFRLEGSNPVVLYDQDFEIAFDLEK